MVRWFSCIASAALIFAASSSAGREGDRILSESLLRSLRESEIPLPTESASRRLEESVLKEIDPKARFLLRDEAESMESEWPPIEYTSVWPKGILYIKCLSMNAGAYDAITNAVLSFTNAPLEGVAVDLRGAQGWNAKELEMVASCFLPDRSPICRIFTGSGRHDTTLKAQGSEILLKDVPTVLIVDAETDGTAEMLAGALSGRDGVLILGEKTSGMACIRNHVPIGAGRFLYIATGWADWGEGVRAHVTPDIPVGNGLDDYVPQPAKRGRQPEELVELLRETASDEVTRRVSDFLLARIRLNRRAENDGTSTETE